MAVDPEKTAYTVGDESRDSGNNGELREIVQAKGAATGEAADLYGDLATAEQFGYVERGLKSRHIQFIALGGTIGTGLFLGIGSAFAKAGPLSVLLGYTFTGVAVFGMMQCLGEMATWLPLPGAIPQYCARYVDPALGFAVGWNNWYQCAITLCAEISAATLLIGFWDEQEKYSPAIWITLVIILILALNIFAVSIYGEAEFIFASIKIITILGLLVAGFVIMLGGAPDHDRRGFRYWSPAMKEYIGKGDTGRFAGLWATLVNAGFSYGGVEMVAVAAGEAANPRKNIPKAVRRVFWRILFFYVLGSFFIGVCINSSNEKLTNDDLKGGAKSPWVIAMREAKIKGLPHIINAVIFTSAASSGNAFLYTGSRYLFGVAQIGQAPRFLLKCTKAGVPIYCVLITAAFSLLTYMSVSTGANKVFTWFQNLVTIAQLFTWCSICIAYTKFRKALIAQNVDRNSLIFRSPYQPYMAWAAFVYFALIIVFNGFAVFTKPEVNHWGPDQLTNFFTAYIGVPIFFLLFGFWKIFKRTKPVDPAHADIWTGKAALDAEVWPDQVPRNALEKFWFWLC